MQSTPSIYIFLLDKPTSIFLNSIPLTTILVKLNLNLKEENYIFTPYNALNHSGIIKCIKPDKLYVNKKEFSNYLVGISDDDFKIDGINCILHSSMKGNLK